MSLSPELDDWLKVIITWPGCVLADRCLCVTLIASCRCWQESFWWLNVWSLHIHLVQSMTNVFYILLTALETPLGRSMNESTSFRRNSFWRRLAGPVYFKRRSPGWFEYYNARFCDIVPPFAAAPPADQHDHMKRLSGWPCACRLKRLGQTSTSNLGKNNELSNDEARSWSSGSETMDRVIVSLGHPGLMDVIGCWWILRQGFSFVYI